MKGLLTKDLLLLKTRKRSLLVFVAVSLVMGFSTDGGFLVGYLCLLSAILAMSTLTIDDADNGMVFLLTMPMERRTYALSKYALGGILCVFGWVFAVVLLLLIGLLRGTAPLPESPSFSLAYILLAVLMLDLMIPLQLKYGAEKSRVILFVLFGAVTAVLFLGKRFFPNGAAEAVLRQLTERTVPSVQPVFPVAVFVLLTLASIAWSVRIMKRKTF